MIDINNIKFTDLSNFELKWRWLDEKYAKFSQDTLSQIIILDSKSSKYINDKLIKYFSNYAFNEKFVKDVKLFEINDLDILEKFWETKINDDVKIIISWDENNSVFTNWKIFKDNWDDFCYPVQTMSLFIQ